ncbi:MAG: SUMF1/EgtB/PvdO family nonheme iron enzyme, partial [Nitrospira sp.]|nr:SUMF1/EgtB/PvdO family nonheme iron enzyme [Nitrospira sp.]
MVPWKSLLSEDQIWKVVAFIHTFSHKGKPSTHSDYRPEVRPKKVIVKDQAPMVLVPAGEFTMGSNEGRDDEKPVHRTYLDAYYIDRYEVTIG